MKKAIALLALICSILLSIPMASAVEIDYHPIYIETDENEARFSLTIEDLPETYKFSGGHAYLIYFFDGSNLYEIGARFFTGMSDKAEGTLKDMQHSLAIQRKMKSRCSVSIENETIIWTLPLPPVDIDDNPFDISFDSISYIGYRADNGGTLVRKTESYRMLEDGQFEPIQEDVLEDVPEIAATLPHQ